MQNLTHFHSPITKQKLSLIKPSHPDIPYSSYDEINNKYKDFCFELKGRTAHHFSQLNTQESQENELFNKYVQRKSLENIIQKSSFSPNFQRKTTQKIGIRFDSDPIKTAIGEKNNITEMAKVVKEQYDKNQEIPLQGHINPVVKFFGSTLIGSVFQALIIKSIEEVCSIKVENSNTMSSQMLNYFGISFIQLKLMKSPEQRKNYIMKCMNKTIENIMNSWREKIDVQEKHYLQSSKEYENLKRKNKEELQDRFPWLNLKTKYISLQKKLKALIIQKFNDYENQVAALETLNQRQSLTKTRGKINHDELKVVLRDISPPKTSSLIRMISQKDEPETPTHYSSILKKIRSQSGFKNSSIDTRISTNSSVKFTPKAKPNPHGLSINNFFQQEVQKDSTSTEEKIPNLIEKGIEWDGEFEEKFKNYMAQGRKLFFNEMKNAKFYEIGVMQMIQELFKEEKKNLARAACMDNYADGGYLTGEELKFLADTSDLMNSCVDKNYIKKVVNLIDPNVLHYIELNLAESIISKYKEMRKIIVDARNKFIKKNNDVVKQKLNDFETKKLKEKQKVQFTKKQLHMSKSIKSVLKKIEGTQEKFEEKYESSLISKVYPVKSMDFEKKFAEYNNLKPYQKANHSEIKKYCMAKEIDTYSNPSHPIVVRHKYHPSSKIFYKNEEKDEMDAEYVKNNMLKYKLQIKSPNVIKEKNNFIKFYSGGPTKTFDEPLYKFPNWIRTPTVFEIKAIIRVQRRARGYIARKKFKALKAQQQQNNFTIFQERINKINVTSSHSIKLKKNASLSPSPSKLNRTFSKIDKYENSAEIRELKIINKSPPKSLLLKHRKLLEAAKSNKFYLARNAGFTYYANDMNVKDKRGNTPLYYTAKNANFDFCLYLIDKGAKVNERCEKGNTAFHIAFSTNSIEIIMLMLDHDGSLNRINDLGQTPLAFATRNTLKRLDLENAIATTTSSSVQNFDNNKCLLKKSADNLNFNEFRNFQLEKMMNPTDKVCIIDNKQLRHLVSFPEKLKENNQKLFSN